jgi:hypothetical protein
VNGIDAEGYSTEPVEPPISKNEKLIEGRNSLGNTVTEVVINVRIEKEHPSGVVYGNEEAKKYVEKVTSEKTLLTKGMFVGATAKQRRERGWNKKMIGSQVNNPFRDEDFAQKIAHLNSLEETFIITYIDHEEQKRSGYGGVFKPTKDKGVYEIRFGEGGVQQGGNKYTALYEEVFHAWSFTKGYFAAGKQEETGGFYTSNYDVYDEVDAKIYSLRAGGYRKTFQRQEGVNVLVYPTELGIMASDKPIEVKAEYLIREIETEGSIIHYPGTSQEFKKKKIVKVGGHYFDVAAFKLERNSKERLYNENKPKYTNKKGVVFFPYSE